MGQGELVAHVEKRDPTEGVDDRVEGEQPPQGDVDLLDVAGRASRIQPAQSCCPPGDAAVPGARVVREEGAAGEGAGVRTALKSLRNRRWASGSWPAAQPWVDRPGASR